MKQLLFLLLIVNTIFLNAMTKKADRDSIDDWEFNATKVMKEESHAGGRVLMSVSRSAMPTSKAFVSKKLGMSVGGAKDTNNFKANIDRGYLPKIDSITYEGQFYNHYFDTGLGERECKELFCPSYSSAKRVNLYSKEQEYFLSVGLNSGIDEKDFKRKKLNLVVVLDISGSMGGDFNSYYYDKSGNKVKNEEKNKKTKMKIATESIVAMLSHLKDSDRVGIALFDHLSYRAKQLNLVGESDKIAIRDHLLELEEKGGTNWSAGYKEGLKLFDKVKLDDKEYENRIVFLTDAMPNSGELKKGKLFSLAKKASDKGIHTTFIGVGVDFNNDLVEYVSKTRGANYFSVHSAKMFKKLLDKEFEYMVTPLVYDLELKLDSKKYDIEAVYGSPDAKIATGEIMKVNTLFPSSTQEGETKGGVVLLKLKKVGTGSDDIDLKVSYKDVNGKAYSNNQSIEFNKQESYYDNSGIQKAILVSDFVTVMKNWLVDARAGCNDNVRWIMQEYPVIMKRCMVFPPKRPIYPTMKTWERKSCKLKVSDGYNKLFSVFRKNFMDEKLTLGDESLQKELDIIDNLLKQPTATFDKKSSKDDWEFVR